MNLYLDEDMASPLLAHLLQRAGHDVQRPMDVGRSGSLDPAQLMHAIVTGRVLISGNHSDFRLLHELVILSGGHHPGILMVRRDNDPRRDLTERGIATAVGKVSAAEMLMTDQFVILNHWR